MKKTLVYQSFSGGCTLYTCSQLFCFSNFYPFKHAFHLLPVFLLDDVTFECRLGGKSNPVLVSPRHYLLQVQRPVTHPRDKTTQVHKVKTWTRFRPQSLTQLLRSFQDCLSSSRQGTRLALKNRGVFN